MLFLSYVHIHMIMKIALVYFEQDLPKDRKDHSVSWHMLDGWQKHYQLSDTKSLPVLLLDKKTKKPNFWQYESVIVENDTPKEYKDVLNKVGWIKHQSYDLLGKCVVMDIDALLRKVLMIFLLSKNQLPWLPIMEPIRIGIGLKIGKTQNINTMQE